LGDGERWLAGRRSPSATIENIALLRAQQGATRGSSQKRHKSVSAPPRLSQRLQL